MKKVLAGLFVTVVAALVSMGFASTAQAYPCPEGTTVTRTTTDAPAECESTSPPKNNTTPPKSEEVTVSPSNASVESSESGILPNTGGPEGVLLIGGVALLAVGGAAVVVARRRQTH